MNNYINPNLLPKGIFNLITDKQNQIRRHKMNKNLKVPANALKYSRQATLTSIKESENVN